MRDGPEKTGGSLLPEVFSRYGKAIARAVSGLVRPHDVEDIVQETYLRIFQASKQRQIHSPRAFMVKTARNLAIDALSKADALNYSGNSAQAVDQEESGLSVDALNIQTPDALLQGDQEFMAFCEMIRRLPRQCRRVFLMKKVYGLSQREIAERLSISEGSVEKHLARAMSDCMRHMDANGYANRRSKTGDAKRAGGTS